MFTGHTSGSQEEEFPGDHIGVNLTPFLMFALETARNHKDCLHMRKLFLELICSNAKQYREMLCVDMMHLGLSTFLRSTAGHLDNHGN